MYKLFPAAQAIKFVVGCHAKCSSLELKLEENSLAPEIEFPCPAKSEKKKKGLTSNSKQVESTYLFFFFPQGNIKEMKN